jgi:hypothetical protein
MNQDKYKEVDERFDEKFKLTSYGLEVSRPDIKVAGLTRYEDDLKSIKDFLHSELSAQEEKIKKDLSETIIKGIEEMEDDKYVGTVDETYQEGNDYYNGHIEGSNKRKVDILTYIKSL